MSELGSMCKLSTSGIASKSEESQVNTLVYLMGDKADDILQSFNLTEADRKKYSTMKDKFERYFVKHRNTIFERAKFNKRKQEDNESVNEFITDVYCLAEHCGYAALRDEMVRDRIVVGIRDGHLSEKMQMDPELTLDKAVNLARQSEAINKQQVTVRGVGDDLQIEPIKASKFHNKKPWEAKQLVQPQVCTRCGKTPPHGRMHCPAKEAVCH